MKYNITHTLQDETINECIIIPVLANLQLSPIGTLIDHTTNGQLSRIIKLSLPQQQGQTIMIYEPFNLKSKQILAVFCTDQAALSNLQFQTLMASVAKAINNQNIRSLCCCLDDFPVENETVAFKVRTAIQQFESVFYRFEQFKTQASTSATLESLTFYTKKTTSVDSIQKAIQQGVAIAEGMKITQNLANMPANHATPTKIASYAAQLAESDTSLKTTIYDTSDAVIRDMGAFLAVAKGSLEPAKFVVIEYTPSFNSTQDPIVLVGKGVTFDSGGISIKPSKGMDEMKFDMTGAASVLGTIRAAAQLKVPTPIVGLLPLTENLPSGSAVKPGDIVQSLSGHTIEIVDTDAEGRLILSDALTYSRRFNPRVVIDIATLTGAVIIALGKVATGLMSTDHDLSKALEIAGEKSLDRVWPLPLWDDYQRLIDSDVADMANLGKEGAGSITAGCFLARFTKGIRWAHLDIAGTADVQTPTKSATGRPVPLLVQYILDYCESL